MLHILGMVGKGIGITLLCILVVLVVLLLCVLFVPIRYRVAGVKEETGKPQAAVRVSWLFHVLSAFATWEGSLHYGLKFCGICIYDNLRRVRKEERHEDRKKSGKNKKRNLKKCPEEKAGDEEKQPETIQETHSQIRQVTPPQESIPPPVETTSVQKEVRPEQEKYGQEEKTQQINSKTSLSGKWHTLCRKIRQFFSMLLNLLQRLLEIPHQIHEKIDRLREKLEKFIAFLQCEELKRAFTLCKQQLLSVLKSVRPRTVKADICFGFEDPSVTGQILAAAGMFYPILGKNIILRPDFETTVCSGRITVKGRITIFVLLRTAWILYFDKDIKRLIRIWKKEEALDGRQ